MANSHSRLINTLNPSHEEREILSNLLRQYNNEVVFESQTENNQRIYIVEYNGSEIEIQLSNTLLKHERKIKKQANELNKIEYRYDVLESLTQIPEDQKGKYGYANHILKTVVLPSQGPIDIKEKNKNKQRIAKRQILKPGKNYRTDQKRDVAEQEEENIQQLPHFHAKKGIEHMMPDGYMEHILIEKRMPGINLEAILEYGRLLHPYPYRPVFNDQIFFTLFKSSVKALKEQFHDQGFLHRDVKGANIMFDDTTGEIEVNFIDPGWSRKINDIKDDRVCSCAYGAPECFLGKSQTEKSDLYSLALVLIELCGGKGRTEVAQAYKPNHSYVEDIKKCPLVIIEILAEMTQFDRDDRPSAEEVLNRLNEIEQRQQLLMDHIDSLITSLKKRAQEIISLGYPAQFLEDEIEILKKRSDVIAKLYLTKEELQLHYDEIQNENHKIMAEMRALIQTEKGKLIHHIDEVIESLEKREQKNVAEKKSNENLKINIEAFKQQREYTIARFFPTKEKETLDKKLLDGCRMS